MPHYRYIGPNDHYLDGGDTKLEPGDEVELDEETVASFPEFFERLDGAAGDTEPATEDVQEDTGDAADQEDDVDEGAEDVDESSSDDVDETAIEESSPDEAEAEVADPPLDPTQFSVDDLKTELDAGDFSDAELDALEDAERADDDPRTTALDAIEAAR